jgi:lipoprotein NlpD
MMLQFRKPQLTISAKLLGLKTPGSARVGMKCLLCLGLMPLLFAACSTNKQQAPIEVRGPQSGVIVGRPDPVRRAEVPASGVTPSASSPQVNSPQARPQPAPGPIGAGPSSTATPTPGSTPLPGAIPGAETGAVKQGSTETRPLGPIAGAPGAVVPPATSSPQAGQPPVVVGVTPIKGGPKAVKRPYSETVLAELKGLEPVATLPPPSAALPGPSASPSPATTPDGKSGRADFAWPSSGKVIANFSEPKQMGLILEGKLGDPIAAVGDGKVIFSGIGPRGYGNLIIVKHEGDLLSVYAHNKSLLAKEGQAVKKGQKIAELGDSGTDRPKLHFEIRRQSKPVDPKPYLPPR